MNYDGIYHGSHEEDFIENFEPDDDPPFAAFLEQLDNHLEEWGKREKVRIINFKRYNEFHAAFLALTKLVKKDNPRAHIQYRMNDTFDTGNVSLTATSYGLEIDNISTFMNIIKHSFNLSLDGTDEKGKIRMTISFKSIYDDLYIGDPVQDESDGK
ncbi:MAG: hypothetical protein FWH57_07775 [Oscillospiraceae bacterium]|nr:hypothetical protein [Oscillospiraceae bacterium]